MTCAQNLAMILSMKTDIDQQVRSRLEGRRSEWAKLAEESGVSLSWIYMWMRGEIPNPGIETLRALSAVLGRSGKKKVKP